MLLNLPLVMHRLPSHEALPHGLHVSLDDPILQRGSQLLFVELVHVLPVREVPIESLGHALLHSLACSALRLELTVDTDVLCLCGQVFNQRKLDLMQQLVSSLELLFLSMLLEGIKAGLDK